MLHGLQQTSDDYLREHTSVVTWLICAVAGAFILQFATEILTATAGREVSGYFALSATSLQEGRVWTFLTHWLIHSTENLFHVGLVLVVLNLVGREVVAQFGPSSFVAVFAISVLAGAAAWCAIHWDRGGSLTGASAGAFGLFSAYALQNPSREGRVLLFFAFPVTIRPMQILTFLLLFELCAFALIDLAGRTLPFEYAPSAHLGGVLAGWAFFKLRRGDSLRSGPSGCAPQSEEKRASVRTESTRSAGEPAGDEPRSTAELRSEIDRILDKIGSQGLASLTDAERKTLDQASGSLHRR